MTTTHPSAPSDFESGGESFALEFARSAGRSGWTNDAFRRFCAAHSIEPGEIRRRWPQGVRSAAREFSAMADSRTAERASRAGLAPLSEVLVRRFEENEGFKASVRRLAWSDLFHPVDTFDRTVRTARTMWRCQSEPAPRSVVGAWWLACLYSACVLLWLSDRPPYRRLRRAARLAARLSGTR